MKRPMGQCRAGDESDIYRPCVWSARRLFVTCTQWISPQDSPTLPSKLLYEAGCFFFFSPFLFLSDQHLFFSRWMPSLKRQGWQIKFNMQAWKMFPGCFSIGPFHPVLHAAIIGSLLAGLWTVLNPQWWQALSKFFKKILFWNDCPFLSAPHPSSPACSQGRTSNQDAPRCRTGLLVQDGDPGSRAQVPAPRWGFGIAGKAQLPHLPFSAFRGWQGTWPPSLAEPPPSLLPSSLMAPPWQPAGRTLAFCARRHLLSASIVFQASLPQAVLRLRRSQPGSQPVSWQESSWLGVQLGITPGDGRGLLWPSSLWKRRKHPGRFCLFLCLFASPLQREGPCYGVVMVSPVLSASLLCYKKGRREPRITRHSTASGQSWSHYLRRVPTEVNGL